MDIFLPGPANERRIPALEFDAAGPKVGSSIEELTMSEDEESFSSFDAFKKMDLDKRFGPAGDGYEYHHIV